MDSGVDARKKRAATYRYHAVRVLLFVGACVCVVAGMLMLSFTTDRQTRAQTVANEVLQAEAQANVLLILSYDDTDPLTPLARAGVLDVMGRSGVSVDVEYMDAIDNPKGSAAYRAWAEALEAKLASGAAYNAVICADDEALDFVAEQHDVLFAGVPVVFFNVNDFGRAHDAFNGGYATGVLEQGYMSKTVELARKLRPNASGIVAVVDDTPSGVGDREQFSAAASEVGVSVDYLDASAMTRDELGQRLGGVGDGSIVFFLDAFTDSSGNAYSRDESARFVSSATPQPVFGVATGGVGEGLVGAGFTDPERDGQRAAEMCIKVLNGTSPAALPIDEQGSGGFVFDAEVMGEHGISAGDLPDDAVMINESVFTWDSLRAYLIPVLLMVLGVVFVLGFALLGYRHSLRDTREIIAQRNDLRHRFYHDHLTEKPNMQWLIEFMDDNAKADKVQSVVAVDFVDFSDVNDSYGRAVGDAMIREFANRFETVDSVFLVRPSGAEFLLGFDHELQASSAEVATIERLLAQPVALDDGEIEVDAHIGIANRSEAKTLRDMTAGVDLAVRESKRAGAGHSTVLYQESMKHEMEEKIKITAVLKQSIKDQSFVVLYQPQVDPRSNEVCGYEALVRLKGNAYYPGQFIPVAEMSGLVVEIDRIVTEKVVRQLATWRKRHKRLAPVSINYSAVQLKDERYVDFLVGLLQEHDVSPSLIKIEITESMLMGDKAKAEELFARLQAEGIIMALDDFGTGYTSLSRVATIPASVVKVDKSLIDTYVVQGQEGPLDNLVRFVHGLGKSVVAEGVETAEQLRICTELGVDVIQGYYYSEPLLPERASQFKPGATEQ